MAKKLVQKVIVHEEADVSPLLPMDVALYNADGTPFSGGGAAPGNATTTTAGLVKKASATEKIIEGEWTLEVRAEKAHAVIRDLNGTLPTA